MKTKKKKIIRNIILIILFLLLCAAVYFFQFTGDGYLLTVPYRPSFREISDHVYINKDYSGDTGAVLDTIERAKARVRSFFGELRCLDDTFIIISDDPGVYKKTGEKDTHTLALPEKRDYISISENYLNIDVIAHELTHAELHSHLSIDAQRTIPTWFDEGLATQNDYREKYSPENWAKLTDNGRNAVPVEDMDTPAEFYGGTVDDKVLRYTCAKHEIAEWLESHSVKEIIGLVDKYNSGEDFYTLYSK